MSVGDPRLRGRTSDPEETDDPTVPRTRALATPSANESGAVRVPVERSEFLLVRSQADLNLATRCVAGDLAAQRELFERERRRVHATLYRILGTNVDIDDLVQDAFLEIFRSLRSFRGEASLRTWVDRCTTRVAYGYFARRPQAARLGVVSEIAADASSAEAQFLAREATRRLYRQLASLDAKQRVAFVLHVIDGRPLSEVAQVMESSLVATKTRVWRARRALEKAARKDAVLADFLGARSAPVSDAGAT
jgi:RNA polymerase sigma-70 factor (ECF subfamily)